MDWANVVGPHDPEPQKNGHLALKESKVASRV